MKNYELLLTVMVRIDELKFSETMEQSLADERKDELYKLLDTLGYTRLEIEYAEAVQYARGESDINERLADLYLILSGTSLADISKGQY